MAKKYLLLTLLVLLLSCSEKTKGPTSKVSVERDTVMTAQQKTTTIKTTGEKHDTIKAKTKIPSIVDDNIAIFPYEKYAWAHPNAKGAPLNQKELEKIDTILQSCIAEHNAKIKEITRGHIDLRQYKRQYIASTDANGDKHVWINCFCQSYGDWKTQILIVDDGGSCYFNLKINVTKGTWYDFWVNGEA